MDLGFMFFMLFMFMFFGIYVKTKDVENVKSVIGHYDYLFSYS